MQARQARVRQIRRTVAAAAVAVFIALFATIFIQMVVGKDPALGASAGIGQLSSKSTSSSSDMSSSSSDEDSSSSPMTTSQS